MVDTTKTKEKPNRVHRRATAARLRHLKADRRASLASEAHEDRKDAIAERVARQQGAAHTRRVARDKVRAEIAAKEGIALRRVVLTSKTDAKEATYVIKKDKSGVARARQEKRHLRHQSFLSRLTRRSQTV